MSQLLLPIIGAVVVFIVLMMLLPKSQGANNVVRRKELLTDLERSREETLGNAVESMDSVINKHDYTLQDALEELTPVGKSLVMLPGGLPIYRMLVQAGVQKYAPAMILAGAAITGILSFLLWNIGGAFSIPVGMIIAFFCVRGFLLYLMKKRLRAFMDRFADGIDMIVRAVKAGNPVNAAMRLVAEHGESPVKDEFRILVDEITYGRPLVDALVRLAKRVPEYDVSFFVVVLTIQQETGGNLGEVLAKLSFIIRKRQELFLKIHAITSEGRASSWILGALPPFVALAVYFTTPGYLDPLFKTVGGNIALVIAISMVLLGFYWIRKLAQIEV